MKTNELLAKFLVWRIKNIRTRNFIILMSIIIGTASGLAAVILKLTVHYIREIILGNHYSGYFVIIYPLIGILITVIISRYLLKEKLGHGITDIIFSITKRSSLIHRSKTYSRMVTSSVTVGFGGSVGLEAPIVVTGSAIGSNLSQLMHLDYASRTILVTCGAAGAISAIFNSPIAGVIFCFEVLVTDLTITGFIPLLIASVSGSLLSLTLLGKDIMFSFVLTEPFKAADTPFYIVLGIVCGLTSLYFTRVTYFVEKKITKIKNSLGRGFIGGILLGIIIFIFPPIYGEGYDSIRLIIMGHGEDLALTKLIPGLTGPVFMILFLFGIILIKPFASAITLGAGGSGGIFAPSLFMGGMTGYLFSIIVNSTGLGSFVSLENFTLVGMCGVMSGVLHAPLTAIFLIAEITSGYALIVPLMIVSAISFYTITYYEKYSIYTKKLNELGVFNPYDKDKQVLGILSMEKMIETDLLPIHPESKLRDLIQKVKQSKRNIFPVVNDKQELLGIITLDDIRDIMFDELAWDTTVVRSLMRTPPEIVSYYDEMPVAMSKFEMSGAWNLPVIRDGKYIGFLSKSNIFNAYRNNLRRKQFE